MSLSSFLFGSAPEKYDNNTTQAVQASQFNPTGANTSLNVQGASSQGPDLGAYNQDRGAQQQYANSLAQAANGQGPSAAAMAGQQSRDASLSQANALQAGRRGANAGAGALGASLASSQGIQQANQTQAQGQANEMATARGQLGSALSGMSSADQNAAQMGTQNNQFNAGLSQQANLANQQTQYGIGGQELAARQQENQMSFSNLNPGNQGALTSILGSAAQGAAGAATKAALARGGVVMPRHETLPHYAGGTGPIGVAPDPSTNAMANVAQFAAPPMGQYNQPASNGGGLGQALGIGQRVMPMFNAGQKQMQAGASALASILGAKGHNLYDWAKGKTNRDDAQSHTDPGHIAGVDAPVTSPDQEQVAQPDTGPVTSPDGYAKGGVLSGPVKALVGEAGKELVVHLGGAIGHGRQFSTTETQGPTVMELGKHGPDAVVNKAQQAEGQDLLSKADGTPSPILSGMADLSARLDRLEKMRGAKKKASGGKR